jgi:nitrogenase molybdenum-cofactor synthesis protein NifE
MIVLQPIADAAHIVHGPIACCGNSWEGRGTLSSKGSLHRMGFTTDMSEMDIIYGSENKLYDAILRTYESVRPKAIFVHATCVSGLIGEDIEAVCKKAEASLSIRVIPVNAPGFVGPKNLGNRIAGEVLLDYVIGTGEPSFATDYDINLIGEYNIAGDLWLVEPLLKEAGIRILSRITGDSTFGEITYAHRAKLNVVVCSRALINIAREMERKYGIPYIEVSFFGKTEMTRALRLITLKLKFKIQNSKFKNRIEEIIKREEYKLEERLKKYSHLRGKRAVLYTGGVKSWSFISALMDLGIEIAAIGTKKSSYEDEEKMKEILGQDAPLIEDVTPKNLLRLMKDKNADILVAGGRNQYLAIKEGYPFVDVNQERHTAYAGYEGLVNLAEQISNSMKFYTGIRDWGLGIGHKTKPKILNPKPLLINPLKHSQSIGAAIAFQGIHKALPIIHGAQGCTFLGKVLLTKHFREPIALASTKLFTENVVMGSEENITNVVKGFIEKNNPDLIGILTSGLSEVKGDDVASAIKNLKFKIQDSRCQIINVATPDYEGGLETGYAKAVESVIESLVSDQRLEKRAISYQLSAKGYINVLAGSHLSPADFTELREIIESFGLRPIILPDLSALDGSRQGMSALSLGGTKIDEIKEMSKSEFTIAIGASMETSAKKLKDRFNIEYKALESIAGLRDTDMLMETLSMLSGKPIPPKYERQRRILIDGMRDAHFYYGNKKICIALEPDLSVQTSSWLDEMGAEVFEVDANKSALFSIEGDFDLLISNSHAEDTAKSLGAPLCQMGFPVYKVLGNNHRITIGYGGTLTMINEIANLLNSHCHCEAGFASRSNLID